MFKKISVALLVTMFVVATPAFCVDNKSAASAPATKVESKSFVTRTKEGGAAVVSKAKDLANSGTAKVSAAAAVVMTLVKEYQWTSAALGGVATFALLYNYNDDFKSMVRGMVGCSEEKECTSFCTKRK